MTDKNYLKQVLSDVAPYIMLDNIYDNATIEKYKEKCNRFLKVLKEAFDWDDIDNETAELLGFGAWESEGELKNLRLIPGYLYPIIPNGLEIVDISGNKEIFDGTQDKDVRCCCLAYGIMIKEEEEEK